MERIRFRLFWVVTLVSLGLVALCAGIAVSLFREQDRIAAVLRENVASRRAAVELEECLAGLIAQEKDRVLSVSALHERAGNHLRAMAEVADQPEERELYETLTTSFAEYLRRWGTLPPPGASGRDEATRDATQFL
jgi:hypothetical protein